MPVPFKMFRIICTLTDKALVSGSDYPNPTWRRHTLIAGDDFWYDRGQWGASGAFWKGEHTVRRHLHNLCHDWVTKWAPSRWPSYPNERDYWREILPTPPDWSRLDHLRVEQIYVSNYQTTTLLAADFMGIAQKGAA